MNQRMKRVVFMGSAEFAVPSLEALVDAGYEVPLVVTRADKPKGRGLALSETPVKRLALDRGLRVFQPVTLKPPEVQAVLRDAEPDLIVVAAYGRILPAEVLAIPPRLRSGHYGCVNVHASLLPKYRGAAPIQWAIVNGEVESGVTIMVMDEGMDTGPIAARRAVAVSPDETAQDLAARLAPLGAALLIETLPGLLDGSRTPMAQDESGATLAPVIRKEHGRLDWAVRSEDLVNRIRGLHPWPGAFTTLPSGVRLRVLPPARVAAIEASGGRRPGEVLQITREGMTVRSGDGSVLLQSVQPEGRRAMTPWELAAGRRLARGDILGAPDGGLA